jgi:hypothetical protein
MKPKYDYIQNLENIGYIKNYRWKLSLVYFLDAFNALFFGRMSSYTADFFMKDILLGIEYRKKKRDKEVKP